MSAATQALVLFVGTERVARGEPGVVVAHAHRAAVSGAQALAVFDARSGLRIDFDLSGSEAEARERLRSHPALEAKPAPVEPRGRGRPRLGVVSREVSLLPRHWSWLAEQSGGASAALRRLVDEARRNEGSSAEARRALEAAHRFLWDMAGNLPQFEEASRALFREDFEQLELCMAGWPPDIASQALEILQPARATEGEEKGRQSGPPTASPSSS